MVLFIEVQLACAELRFRRSARGQLKAILNDWCQSGMALGAVHEQRCFVAIKRIALLLSRCKCLLCEDAQALNAYNLM